MFGIKLYRFGWMAVGLSIGMLSMAQPTNVRLDVWNGGGFQPCEPSIAIDPNNPDIVVAGSILDNVYYSRDGGATWTKDKLTSPLEVFGDPCIVASPTGDFYYLHLSDPEGRGWSSDALLDRIVCQRSKDGGKTWSDGGGMGLTPPKDQDKEWAVVNADGSRIHACWTQFDKYDSTEPQDSTVILCSFSNQKGKKWSAPVRVSDQAGDCLDSDDTTEGAVPALGGNDEIFVAWALGEWIYFDKSFDGGLTWGKDRQVTQIVGGWDQSIPGIGRVNGMPVTCVDLSDGPHRGRIYVNWTDDRHGDSDVWIVHSDDQGDSWSDPIRVNLDDSGQDQFFTWMSVDPIRGDVHVVYYDRSHNGSTKNRSTHVAVASSTDGGLTWSNQVVSESAFTPKGRVFFGDYNNISSVDGHIRPIWTREDKGILSVWTALLDLP